MKLRITWYLFLMILLTGNSVLALEKTKKNKEQITVNSAKELYTVLTQMKQGGIINLQDGEYKNVKFAVNNQASKNHPLMIRAITPGKVVFSGDCHIDIFGDYIHLSGIEFSNIQRKKAEDLIRDKGKYNSYSKLKFLNTADVDGVSIKLEGQFTEVHHCDFIGKTTGASYINMDIPKKEGSYHHVYRNFFARPPLHRNGGSAMRVGHGSMTLNHAYVTIEENLFENCDGESEIISIKSSRNYIRNNTFRNCAGGFSLRQGRGSIVEGNFFIGNGTKRCHGIGIRGRDHYIFNNYFYKINAKESGVFSFGVASPEDPERIKLGLYPRHFPMTQDIYIFHNTVIDNYSPYNINFLGGYGTRNRFELPKNIVFYNNIFDKTPDFMNTKKELQSVFVSNYFANKKSVTDGVVATKLKLTKRGELQVPVANSTFQDKSVAMPFNQANYKTFIKRDFNVDYDIFGRKRDSQRDSGCFELNSADEMVNVPLNKEDVGCSY
ncbi:hypothetical protein EYV94_21405 [Puteibacter caeruleilacunae]|nr:hypothetical protein EYV94_21405 [Puteibacter caeruleilacunae]